MGRTDGEIMKRDWLGIVLIVSEVLIILTGAALVYTAFHIH
jgi:hypothetical protein